MSHNVLITGASGYLGGTLLARWKDANLPPYANLYALVRSPAQAQAVSPYGARPLIANLEDHDTISDLIVEKRITIIYFLIDATTAKHQPIMIEALGKVRKQTGMLVHFLYTTGTKQFSNHVGMRTDGPLLDTDANLYDIIQQTTSPHDKYVEASRVNDTMINIAEANDVRSYIFAPCIVYGPGEGFGNRISIQNVALVKIAQKLRRLHSVDAERTSWPVCHISDNTTLYLQIMAKILAGDEIGYGKDGFYLASSGSVAWGDIYKAMAKALLRRNVIDTDTVELASEADLSEMGSVLEVPPQEVPVMIGGMSVFTAKHGAKIGWNPQYPPEHILEAADDEVEFILNELRQQE